MTKEKQIDYKEYARQMRENAVRDSAGNVICSAELWEELASKIESFAGYRKQSEGKWVLVGIGNSGAIHWKCSVCGFKTLDLINGDTNFCINCGADMRGGEKKEAPKKCFSPEDVRKMSRSEMRANYQAIMKSMKEWK